MRAARRAGTILVHHAWLPHQAPSKLEALLAEGLAFNQGNIEVCRQPLEFFLVPVYNNNINIFHRQELCQLKTNLSRTNYNYPHSPHYITGKIRNEKYNKLEIV